MSDNKVIIAIPEGKIRDYIDGTIRIDTPEEYVRQTVEKRLVNEHKYTKDQIQIEYPVQIGAGKKRADFVLQANELRYEAYVKEQEALKIMNDEVIFKDNHVFRID